MLVSILGLAVELVVVVVQAVQEPVEQVMVVSILGLAVELVVVVVQAVQELVVG